MPCLRIFVKRAHHLSVYLRSSIQTSGEKLRATMPSLLNSINFENGHSLKARLHGRLLHFLTKSLPTIFNIFSWISPAEPDTSKTIPVSKQLSFNSQFLFPFSIICSTMLHCLLMLISNQLDCLVTHQIFPAEIWSQADIIFSIGGSMSLLIYLCLLFCRQQQAATKAGPSATTDLNCSGPSNTHQKQLQSTAVDRRVFTFRRRARLATQLMLLQLILYAELYFTYQMLLVHQLPPQLVLLLTLYFPLFTAYCILSNIGLLTCFLIASQCLQIRQAGLLLGPMRTAVARLKKWPSFEPAISRLWRQFGGLNQQAISLNRELRKVNQSWGLFITIYFVGYILLICYMAYCFLFSHSSFFARSLFMFLVTNNLLLLSLVIHQCTGLLRQNRAFRTLNLQLCCYFQGTFSSSKEKMSKGTFQLTESSLIKVICFLGDLCK